MSNKNKKKTDQQKNESSPKSGGKTTNSKSSKINTELKEGVLIYFDKKVKIFLVLLIGVYILASLLKIQTSSVSLWSYYFGEKHPKSVIAGTPKGIRQDEWMLSTPNFIGQYRSGFPLSNATFGDGNVPVMFGLPVKDFSMALKPQLWPYFVFDIERAFAFSWNFTIAFLLISTFLLLMLLTRSNFWISVLGSFFIFFSGGMQWWSYWLGVSMLFLNGIILSLAYILYSKNKNTLIAAGVILIISCYSFIVNLYPPWQVPLFYLYVAILVGFIAMKKDFKTIRENSELKVAVLSVAMVVLGVFLYHYYELIKSTSELIMNTAYPGKRSTNGGDLISGKLFAEFFGPFMSDTRFPKEWLNICEASGFIMFFPILFYVLAYDFIKTKKTDWLLVSLSVYVIAILAWVLIGFPDFLSKASLLSMSPAYRALPVLGVGNCFLLFCYLGNRKYPHTVKLSLNETGILLLATILFIWSVGSHINSSTSNFFNSNQIALVLLVMTSIYLLIRYKQLKYAQPVLAVLLIGMVIPNININPLTSGLSSVLENPLVKATGEIHKTDPNARWAVFGDQHMSNLLKVNGINVFNGVKTVPLLKDLAVLDPSGKSNFIYNRYAHINMFYLIDMKDSIQFKLNENNVVNDNYSIYMDPCSPRLNKLGIKYFLFTYKPKEIETRCMTEVSNILGMYIYKANP